MYVADANNGGTLPPDLPTLAEGQYVTADMLLCPVTHKARTCDYFYYAKNNLEAYADPPNALLACDLPGNHGKEPLTVLFADGHVESADARRMQQLFSQPQNAEFAAALKAAETAKASNAK
jgi:prepilin-type processing-associated H-X9-DG protein